MMGFMWLAAVVAIHPNSRVEGRTRLQKTIKLLQSVGLPTGYNYMIHFYGPYSEELQSDIGLLESMDILGEEAHVNGSTTKYIIKASDEVFQIEPNLREKVESFRKYIDILNGEKETVVLELAATYDSFREVGGDHDDALKRLRLKKPEKCTPANEKRAIELLNKMGISYT